MTDIVERLRDMQSKKYSKDWAYWVSTQTGAAATEIERLRAALRRAIDAGIGSDGKRPSAADQARDALGPAEPKVEPTTAKEVGGLDGETRTVVDTTCAAFYLNRKPQTLRSLGPLRRRATASDAHQRASRVVCGRTAQVFGWGRLTFDMRGDPKGRPFDGIVRLVTK